MTVFARSLGLVLVLSLPLPAARAELISYSFSGSDTATGSPVSGLFAYQTNTPAHGDSTDATFFLDVGGQLVINALGQTYASNSVTGVLHPDSLTLLSLNGHGGAFGIILKSATPGVIVFPDQSSLPPKLDRGAFGGSEFAITELTGNTIISTGTISLEGPVMVASLAPEPGSLALAGLGLGLALLYRRRY